MNPTSSPPRFGLLILGDEILSGKRQDKHMPKVIELLSARGHALSWARYLGDDREAIAQALRDAFQSGDVVFSCGGIGATPDDHTRQAAAAAAGVELAMHPVARDLIEQRMQAMAREAGETFDAQRADNVQRLHMAVLPATAEIIPNPFNRIAGFSVGHAHFFPGFPVMAHPMMAWVLDRYYAQWQQVRDWTERALILPNASEAVLTPVMESIEQRWPDVKIFSLPSVDHPVHGPHIELGVKGPNAQADAAFAALQQTLHSMHIAWREPA